MVWPIFPSRFLKGNKHIGLGGVVTPCINQKLFLLLSKYLSHQTRLLYYFDDTIMYDLNIKSSEEFRKLLLLLLVQIYLLKESINIHKKSCQKGHCTCIFIIQIYFSFHTGNSHGSLTYSEIKVFMKRQPTDITMYKSITTSSNQTINISGNHIIYRRKSATDKFNPV